MSRVESPREYSARILSSNPSKRRWRLRTIWAKAPVAIPRRVDPDPAVLGDQRLRRCAVARVPRAAGRLRVGFIAQMVGLPSRPPSPFPPAAWSAAPESSAGPAISPSSVFRALPAARRALYAGICSPPGRLTTPRSLARSTASSISRSLICEGCPSPGRRRFRFQRLAAVSQRRDIIYINGLVLVVEGMTLPFDHAYTDPRTVPVGRGGAAGLRAGRLGSEWRASDGVCWGERVSVCEQQPGRRAWSSKET